MKISVLQHEPSEGAGEIGNWFVAHGHSLQVHHLYRDEPVPALSAFDLLVVMGGEMNIYQYRNHPWLKPERQLIEATLAAGKRVIGICLGAQLIADALGKRVTQNPLYEIGWFPVRFTPEAQAAILGLPDSALVLHWHGDTFELPPGATRLAVSDMCPEQGFLIPRKCLGLQFHLETDAPIVRQMVEGSSDYTHWPKGPHVQHPDLILQQVPETFAANRDVLYRLLDAFMAS